jgi:hypothetical protein
MIVQVASIELQKGPIKSIHKMVLTVRKEQRHVAKTMPIRYFAAEVVMPVGPGIPAKERADRVCGEVQ